MVSRQAGSYESMCNPILQAMIANHHQSQFNVLLGLCVGHDSLYFRYAEAPSTLLAVKDRAGPWPGFVLWLGVSTVVKGNQFCAVTGIIGKLAQAGEGRP
jgi:hypothetical protein